MATFWDQIKRMIFGTTRLTPLSLEQLIIENFMEGMKESTLKNHVYYPTSFTLFLENSDFERLNQHFQSIFEDAVDEFVKILTHSIPKGNYIPHSRTWHMQFIQVTEGTLFQGKTIDLPSGNVLIVSALYPKGEGQKSTNTVVATKTKMGSAGGRYDVNPEILNEITEDGPFSFRKKLVVVPKGVKADNPKLAKQPKASLALISAGTFVGGKKSVGLVESQVKICGRSGFPAAGVQIVRIDDDLVSNPHFIIYANDFDGTFTIEAKANLTLNGKSITGGTEILPNNALIVVSNKYQLRFTIIPPKTNENFFAKWISKIIPAKS